MLSDAPLFMAGNDVDHDHDNDCAAIYKLQHCTENPIVN